MSTDLLTLPFMDHTCDTTIPATMPQQDVQIHPTIVLFTQSVQTSMHAIRFANQSLGNPQISTLLKAVRHSFLNIILRYLTQAR
jgi:hypothetical protein